MEEYVLNFVESEELTPIDVVSDLTGLTYEEIRSTCKIIKIDTDSYEPSNDDIDRYLQKEYDEEINK